MQSQKRKRYHKDNAPADDIVTLINLVRQNPALYNYKLQPNQRRRADVLNGWAAIAAQIGNKYTVEEVRRKWKNLRDTYHQYRLRKPKYIEGRLSKWRYAKELEFLSNVYQPKLKSQRTPSFDTTVQETLMQMKQTVDEDVMETMEDDDEDDDDDLDDDHVHSDSITHHATSQILVNDETEAFILTAYEESVNDDVVTTIDHHHHHQQQHHHHSSTHHSQHQHLTHHHHQQQHHHHHHHHHHNGPHDDPSIASIELAHVDDVVDDVVDDDEHDVRDIVKHEHGSSLDDDGATGADVDYEEVCLYEEAGNGTSVDCEIGVDGSAGTSPNGKSSYYIDATEFCINAITASTTPTRSSQYVSSSSSNSILAGGSTAAGSSGGGVGTKLKNLTLVTTTQASRSIGSSCLSADAHLITSGTTLTGVSGTETNQSGGGVDIATSTVVASTTNAGGLNTAGVVVSDALSTTAAYATQTILQLPTLTTGGSGVSASSLCNSGTAAMTTINSNMAAAPSTTTSYCTPNNGGGGGGGGGGVTLYSDDCASAISKRDELDLFFEFLKKKIQCFPKSEITHIQVEFLNCVLRREAGKAECRE